MSAVALGDTPAAAGEAVGALCRSLHSGPAFSQQGTYNGASSRAERASPPLPPAQCYATGCVEDVRVGRQKKAKAPHGKSREGGGGHFTAGSRRREPRGEPRGPVGPAPLPCPARPGPARGRDAAAGGGTGGAERGRSAP